MDELAKKLLSHIYEPSHERVREIIKSLRWWDDERYWEIDYQIKIEQKKYINYYYSSWIKPRVEPTPTQTQLI
jgi:hypothetical protein